MTAHIIKLSCSIMGAFIVSIIIIKALEYDTPWPFVTMTAIGFLFVVLAISDAIEILRILLHEKEEKKNG